ncbi:MAG: helix-turn-helix transcriptional regulator [Mangrovibacterium sp.]
MICPQLSPAEKKLAAFIKLGLTSKEIASLTSNTTASIDVSRSRLRKKLELERCENFESFLVDL